MQISSPAAALGLLPLVFIGLSTTHTLAATLEVGPGKTFARIEDANAKARPGDMILVYPQPGLRRYEKSAVLVRQPNLTFRGMPAAGKAYVPINGHGFDYSGAGSTPRAVFQFNPGADHCTLENFELVGAHNSSHNGAGVRINQANHVTILNCSIHGNDMGIMSNGDGTLASAVDQRIERCIIARNGDPTEPGYNHNLYLGGTSVTLRFCEVYRSLTGHNVKSRAHYTRIEYCYVHHSANREFDLVDAAETGRSRSDAVLLGNIIAKDAKCPGNREVIHFGQDGGKPHNGTLYLAFNSIETPFIAPVVELTAAGARARLVGNVISSGGVRQAGQKAAGARGGPSLQDIAGEYNWFYGDFSAGDTGLAGATNHFEPPSEIFKDAHADDYRLVPAAARGMTVPAAAILNLPTVPGMAESAALHPLDWQYHHPAESAKRTDGDNPVAGAVGR